MPRSFPLSRNFDLSELEASYTASRLGISNKIPREAMPYAVAIVEHVMQPLRDVCGPIRIHSGYRCEALNKAVGGSKRSQHVYGPDRGAACDFTQAKGEFSAIELAQTIVRVGLPFDQLILEFTESQSGGWVHCSIAPKKVFRGQILKIDRGKQTRLLTTGELLGMRT